MATFRNPCNYKDERGNIIQCDRPLGDRVTVTFRGANNVLKVHPDARIKYLKVMFDCNGGYCEIGKNTFKGKIRIGESCSVKIGDGVTCTGGCYISTAEGSSVSIGNDCMIASENEIRSDDGHPIFCVHTGVRLNPAKSIVIEDHVWLAARAVVLSGTRIGAGSVVGFGSIAKGRIPNNCVAVGSPARVVRKDCVWERPHLTLKEPFFKPDVSTVEKSVPYWKTTRAVPVRGGIGRMAKWKWWFQKRSGRG